MYRIDKSRKDPASVRRAPDRKQAAFIRYHMTEQGVTQSDIAELAGVRRQMVQLVVYGLRTSGRVQAAIANALGFESWSDLCAKKRSVAA